MIKDLGYAKSRAADRAGGTRRAADQLKDDAEASLGLAPAGFAGAWVLFIFLLIGFGFSFLLL